MSIQQNGMLSGLILGSAISTFSSMISGYVNSLINFLKSLFVASIAISSDIEYYDCIYDYFSNAKIVSSTQIYLQRYASNVSKYRTSYDPEPESKEHYILADGVSHIVWYKNRLLFVSRGIGTYARGETIKIEIPFGSRAFIDQMICDIRKEYNKETDDVQVKMYNEISRNWDTQKRHKRRLDTLILPPEIKDTMVDDISWFMRNKEWYFKKDIHYHRGYLLAGPPGTGKSSLITALASHFNLKLYTFSLDRLSDTSFCRSVFNIEKNSIVVIEDIDRAAMVEKDTAAEKKTGDKDKIKDEGKNESEDEDDGDNDKLMISNIRCGNSPGDAMLSRILANQPRQFANALTQAAKKSNTEIQNSFRNLLQILDGLQTPDGAIFILTANEPEKINPVLLRSGRIDRRIDFQYAEPWQAEQMFLRFFEDEPDLAKKFGQKFHELFPEKTPASRIQEHLVEVVKQDNPLKAFVPRAPVPA